MLQRSVRWCANSVLGRIISLIVLTTTIFGILFYAAVNYDTGPERFVQFATTNPDYDKTVAAAAAYGIERRGFTGLTINRLTPSGRRSVQYFRVENMFGLPSVLLGSSMNDGNWVCVRLRWNEGSVELAQSGGRGSLVTNACPNERSTYQAYR
jgi:hypothetical protein